VRLLLQTVHVGLEQFRASFMCKCVIQQPVIRADVAHVLTPAVLGAPAVLQPMMMPLLQEMPEGRVGIQVMQQAVHTTLFGES
jgi:hypothetical protein